METKKTHKRNEKLNKTGIQEAVGSSLFKGQWGLGAGVLADKGMRSRWGTSGCSRRGRCPLGGRRVCQTLTVQFESNFGISHLSDSCPNLAVCGDWAKKETLLLFLLNTLHHLALSAYTLVVALPHEWHLASLVGHLVGWWPQQEREN